MDSLFLGTHKSRPAINLGGVAPASSHSSPAASSSHAAADLVSRAKRERQQRELDRKRLAAVNSIQAFYRGRRSAATTRTAFRTQFDALLNAATPPRTAAEFVVATRLLVAGAYRRGNPADIKRLALWCRIALQPPATTAAAPLAPSAGQKQPPLLFAPFGSRDGPRWAVLLRMTAGLLLVEATSAVSLPQAPLFLEIVKMVADPASYPKYAVPLAIAPPTALLTHLLDSAELYPRVGRALATIPPQQRTHPCLSPLLTLSLLPLRALASSDRLRQRTAPCVAFSTSVLTVPLLFSPGRIAQTNLAAQFRAPSPFPLWDLVAALNVALSFNEESVARLEQAQTVALLANLVELVKGRLVPVPAGAAAVGSSGAASRTATTAGCIENGKQLVAYLDVLRKLLGSLPLSALVAVEPAPGAAKQAAGVVETIVLDDSSSESEEEGEHGEETGAQGARRSRRDDDGDETMTDPAEPTRATFKLDARARASMAYLWSRDHLLALLSLSTRYSASSRPALCGYLVALLAPTTPPSPVRDSILNTLLYSPLSSGLLRELFRGYMRSSELGKTLASATKREKSAVVLAALRDEHRFADEWPVLVLAIEMYARSLLTMGDDEFYAAAGAAAATGRNALTLDEVVTLSAMVRNATFALYWQDESGANDGAGDAVMVDPVAQQTKRVTVAGMGGWAVEDVRAVMTRFLQQVHARDSRRQFTPEGHWHMTSAFDLRSFVETAVYEDERLEAEAEGEEAPVAPSAPTRTSTSPFVRRGLARNTNDDRGPARSSAISKRQLALISPRLGILRNIPFVVPFETRVAIFRQFVANDFRKLGLGDATSYMARSRHRAVVRRTHLAEDAYTHMNGLGPELKKRIEIVFIDEHGMEESGIDGGGLFKELLTSLSKEVFDTNRGLWLATSEQELYPNPHGYAKESNQLSWFKFIGRILGKALYQGILVNVKFADFFLAKWLGRQSYLDDLASLDPELYNGLLKLKTYPGNVEEDLSLNFTITEEDFGVSRSVDLIPGGSEIPVTNDNRMQYIVLVSNYRLNVQIAPQCRAFYSGLFEMINPRWLRMFNQSELAVLVGGTDEAIDIDDLRRNTVYSGWAAEENTPTVRHFWDAVASFSREERAKLVKFVTACERPPLLGFGQLNPLFAIRNAGSDESRLPTSSTCVNLLKLPAYEDPRVLREKLLYAINSGAGFDLS